jgi:hypothetical protein
MNSSSSSSSSSSTSVSSSPSKRGRTSDSLSPSQKKAKTLVEQKQDEVSRQQEAFDHIVQTLEVELAFICSHWKAQYPKDVYVEALHARLTQSYAVGPTKGNMRVCAGENIPIMLDGVMVSCKRLSSDLTVRFRGTVMAIIDVKTKKGVKEADLENALACAEQVAAHSGLDSNMRPPAIAINFACGAASYIIAHGDGTIGVQDII